MELYDVVTRLAGPINPIGETQTDEQRFKNLQVITDLVEKLLSDIDIVAENINRHEFSLKRAGEYASKFYDRCGIEK